MPRDDVSEAHIDSVSATVGCSVNLNQEAAKDGIKAVREMAAKMKRRFFMSATSRRNSVAD